MADPTRSRCPACHSTDARPVTRAAIPELTEQWRRDPACALEPGSLERQMQALFGGAEWVEMARCPACGLEEAFPGVSWPADGYPRHLHYLAFDHARALARLRSLPRGRLLELGCGDGLFLSEAASIGFDAVGLDFDAEAVGRARSRGLDARVGEVATLGRDIGGGGGAFNVIALFQILEHVPDPDGLLRDLAPLADAGCALLIGVPAPHRFGRVVGHPGQVGGSEYWDWPPQHVMRWTPPALGHLLRRNGWRLDEVIEEPLSLRGAAATLTAIEGEQAGWYSHPLLRRVHTLGWLLRVSAARLRGPVTGTRLFASATRP